MNRAVAIRIFVCGFFENFLENKEKLYIIMRSERFKFNRRVRRAADR